jgi:hypothetical protein
MDRIMRCIDAGCRVPGGTARHVTYAERARRSRPNCMCSDVAPKSFAHLCPVLCPLLVTVPADSFGTSDDQPPSKSSRSPRLFPAESIPFGCCERGDAHVRLHYTIDFQTVLAVHLSFAFTSPFDTLRNSILCIHLLP